MHLFCIAIFAHTLFVIPEIPEEELTVMPWPHRVEPYAVVEALTPTQGCDKLYPKWIADKVSQLLLLTEGVIDLILGHPQRWKWPIKGRCLIPTDEDIRRRRIVFYCTDNFWLQQMYQPIPKHERRWSGYLAILCPQHSQITCRYIFYGPQQHDQRYMCFCKPIRSVVQQVVRLGTRECLDVDFYSAGTIVAWLSTKSSRTISRITLVRAGNVGADVAHANQRSGLDNYDFEAVQLSLSVPAGIYRVCVTNQDISDITLHVATVYRLSH